VAERNTIGGKLKAVRESRKLSAELLADRAGLSAELVTQIEEGSLIPSLAPLIRLARALGVRLGTFLDDQENVGPVIVRSGERHKVVRFSDKNHPGHSDLDFFSLAANKASRHMEPFLIDIHPSSADEAKPSAHEGEEFIYVFSGDVEVMYGSEIYRLGAGDSIYYDSIVAHNVHSTGNRPARILAVVYAPS
jgi:transcriptional regulator with XRE-family HTH domain